MVSMGGGVYNGNQQTFSEKMFQVFIALLALRSAAHLDICHISTKY